MQDQIFAGQESQLSCPQKLTGHCYLVKYKKGKENTVADALSRCNEGNVDGNLCGAITIVELSWLKDVQDMGRYSNFFQQLKKRPCRREVIITLLQGGQWYLVFTRDKLY